jgi:hypothetical protein
MHIFCDSKIFFSHQSRIGGNGHFVAEWCVWLMEYGFWVQFWGFEVG